MAQAQITLRLLNKEGLHARPAVDFVRTANKFRSDIKVEKDGREADVKSILGILSLAAENNDVITIKCSGDEAEEALKELVGQLRAVVVSGFRGRAKSEKQANRPKTAKPTI